MKQTLSFVLVLGLALSVSSFRLLQSKPWAAPEAFAKKANPVKSDAESLKTGKEIWTKHCQSCHGKTGAGDGTKAATLETEMKDFATAEIQGQSDGSMFYKIIEGRDDMPTFKKKIPDETEIWSVINYVRTLKAK